MSNIESLPDLTPVIVEHGQLRLIGIPCIGLKDMSSKYHNAKHSLLGAAAHYPQVLNPRIHYGMWPQTATQDVPEAHAYILCMEVSSFDGIPDWFVKLSVPPQRCIVAASSKGDFDAAGEAIESYIRANNVAVGCEGRAYTICERYRYDGEGFARYSLPIVE